MLLLRGRALSKPSSLLVLRRPHSEPSAETSLLLLLLLLRRPSKSSHSEPASLLLLMRRRALSEPALLLRRSKPAKPASSESSRRRGLPKATLSEPSSPSSSSKAALLLLLLLLRPSSLHVRILARSAKLAVALGEKGAHLLPPAASSSAAPHVHALLHRSAPSSSSPRVAQHCKRVASAPLLSSPSSSPPAASPVNVHPHASTASAARRHPSLLLLLLLPSAPATKALLWLGCSLMSSRVLELARSTVRTSHGRVEEL